jgi:hypothetical protein
MYYVSPVTLDLPLRLLTVHQHGKPIVLTDHTVPPPNCVLSAEAMNKLLSKSILGYIIQIHSLQTEQTATVQHLSAEIDKLIESFAEVFSEPTELPPSRACDHSIIPTPGEQPPNLRPYRVPHMQKKLNGRHNHQTATSRTNSSKPQSFLIPSSNGQKEGWQLAVMHRLQTLKLHHS